MEYSNIKLGKIGMIVVLYNPNFVSLRKSLAVLRRSADVLCLVDNSNIDSSGELCDYPEVLYIPLLENRGIAAAQNVGLRALKDTCVEYVVFSDQDSLASPNTVALLQKTYVLLCDKGIKVGGVGTRPFNVETGKPYRAKSKEYGICCIGKGNDAVNVTKCDDIISSISFMRLSAFVEVGGFDEALFIDGVDNEWCWRAAVSGYEFYIVEEAKIMHHLGEGDKHVAGCNVSISSAFRIYYQFRNYIWLCRRKYVPEWWKRKHLFKYALKMIYYPLCVSPRLMFVKRIFRGIVDGLCHRQEPIFGKI